MGPHCCKFAGYGSASFSYLKRNDIPSWSVLHSSFQINSCSGRSHFVKTPCFANSIALAFLWSSCSPYFRLNHNAPTAEALAYCWNVTFTRLVQCLYWLLFKHWIIVFFRYCLITAAVCIQNFITRISADPLYVVKLRAFIYTNFSAKTCWFLWFENINRWCKIQIYA